MSNFIHLARELGVLQPLPLEPESWQINRPTPKRDDDRVGNRRPDIKLLVIHELHELALEQLDAGHCVNVS